MLKKQESHGLVGALVAFQCHQLLKTKLTFAMILNDFSSFQKYIKKDVFPVKLSKK